jgi:hypothetical protein
MSRLSRSMAAVSLVVALLVPATVSSSAYAATVHQGTSAASDAAGAAKLLSFMNTWQAKGCQVFQYDNGLPVSQDRFAAWIDRKIVAAVTVQHMSTSAITKVYADPSVPVGAFVGLWGSGVSGSARHYFAIRTVSGQLSLVALGVTATDKAAQGIISIAGVSKDQLSLIYSAGNVRFLK